MSSSLVCPMWRSVFIVPSHSDEDKDYMVKFFTGQIPVCTCPAYRYSGGYDEQTCKHINTVKKFGCFYYQPYNDEKENILTCGHNDLDSVKVILFSTTEKHVTEEKCPGCNNPMVEVIA